MARRAIFGALVAIAALTPHSAAAGAGWNFWVQPPGAVVSIVTTLRPSAAWSGAYNSSGGQTPQPDNVAYGQQTILAVGADGALSGVPQLTVPSTATMSEGEEWRVDGTGLAGLDNMWRLHVVDATHVDLCFNMDFSGVGTGQCKLDPVANPNVATAGYSGSGGRVWFDETPAAQFDEHPSVQVDAGGIDITVGAGTGSRAWIDHVDFCLDTAAQCVRVSQQTQNAARRFGGFAPDFGWVANIASRGILDAGGPRDGLAKIYAIVTPVNGFQRVISMPVVLNSNATIPHPVRYVDNSDPAASDTACDGQVVQGDATETSTHCPWKTIAKAACAAATLASPGTLPVVHVAGAAVAGTAGRMYQEIGTPPCGVQATEYPVRFVADGPVYVTSAVGEYDLTTWNILAQKVEFVGGFFIDQANTSPSIRAANSMFWLGQGSGLVEARGALNQLVGSRGLPYGWRTAGGWNGSFPKYYDLSSFYGLGEATINALAANGYNLYRNVSGTVSIDVFRHPTTRAREPLGIFNYAVTVSNSNVQTYHTDQVLTVQSAACVGNSEVVTVTTNPLSIGQPFATPSWLTVLTGNGGTNNGNNPYFSSGEVSTFAVSAIDGSAKTITLSNDSGHKQPCSSFAFQSGDTVVAWVESHSDCFQTTNFNYMENVYAQNYRCTGFNSQPALFQQNYAPLLASAMTTSGRTFAVTPGNVVDLSVDDLIVLPYGSGFTNGSRRVTSVTQQGSDFVANETASTSIKVTSVNAGPILPGMHLYTISGGVPAVDYGKTILSQSGSDEPDGSTGGRGTYVMSAKQGTSNTGLHFTGMGATGGTLVGGFPQDVTSPVTFKLATQAHDVACVNCLFDGVNQTGVQMQFQSGQRNVVFQDFTLATSTVAPSNQGTVSFITTYSNYAAEAEMLIDAVVGYAQSSTTNTPYFGTGTDLINVLYTRTANPLYTDGSRYLPGVSFAASGLLNALSGLPTIGAKSAAAVPWDINGSPRLVGAPVGAVVH